MSSEDLDVPPPDDVAAQPRALMAELTRHVDEETAARVCADLLGGADPQGYPAALPYLAGRAAPGFLAGTWGPGYWSRIWGARGLLYVWTPDATSAVVAGLPDPAWRVGEMCLKVAAKREIFSAGDGAARLADHELPRVRGAAMRALGAVGDTEHVRTVRAALDDPDPDVRRHADRALTAMAERLDLAEPPAR
ncbi:MAG: HEAT repeat domain-containing protein [Geodermatophilaceae bacterium]